MVMCAKFDGRQVRDCTRGVKNCPCLLEKMQEVLSAIGFPKRGSWEEEMDSEDMAKYVQDNFSRKELGIE